VTRLQSGVSFPSVVTTIGVGAVGADEVVVVVREACDVAMYRKLCAISSSPSYQVTGERTKYILQTCSRCLVLLQMPASRRVRK
jgi:hypothetical protein